MTDAHPIRRVSFFYKAILSIMKVKYIFFSQFDRNFSPFLHTYPTAEKQLPKNNASSENPPKAGRIFYLEYRKDPLHKDNACNNRKCPIICIFYLAQLASIPHTIYARTFKTTQGIKDFEDSMRIQLKDAICI